VTGTPPDRFVVSRGHSPPIIGGRLIHMLRVTVIFAFARSAMPVLHTLVRGCVSLPHLSARRNGAATANGAAASLFPFGLDADAAPPEDRQLVILPPPE
jgi:hypothetical protein